MVLKRDQEGVWEVWKGLNRIEGLIILSMKTEDIPSVVEIRVYFAGMTFFQ